MIRIRSVALGLAILAGSAVAAGAQTTTPPAGQQHRAHGAWKQGGQHGMMGRRLFNGIDLTADQKAQIKQIHEKYRGEMRAQFGAAQKGAQGDVQGARRERPQLTPEQRQQMRAQHEREMAEIRGVLTPAQQQRFDANVADMKAQREAHMKNRGQQRQG